MPAQAFTTIPAHPQLYPIPLALPDQLYVSDWQMIYGPHCFISISSSSQLPNMPCRGPTGHKPLCHVVRAILLILPQMSLVLTFWLSMIFKPPVFTIYTKGKFSPQIWDLASLFSLIALPHSALHLHLTSYSCIILHLCLTSSCTPCYYSRRPSLIPLLHPQSLIGLMLQLSFTACSFWSKPCQRHIIIQHSRWRFITKIPRRQRQWGRGGVLPPAYTGPNWGENQKPPQYLSPPQAGCNLFPSGTTTSGSSSWTQK